MLVRDIYEDLKAILGNKDEDSIFATLTHAIESLSNETEWDPLIGYVDICVGRDRCIALPQNIETPLAVNIGGRPARFRNQWFEFHMNGPGSDCGPCLDWSWDDRGVQPTMFSLQSPSKIIAQIESPEDNGIRLLVQGFGQTADGIRFPIRTRGVAQRLASHLLTATFVQPSALTPVTLNLNTSDSLFIDHELVISSGDTGRDNFYIIQDILSPTQISVVQSQDAPGSNEATGTVFPTTSVLRQRELLNGYQVPTVSGYSLQDADAPYFVEVTAISKPVTAGCVRVVGLDNKSCEGALLAYMWQNETTAAFRRIRVNRDCTWVRMRYRKRNFRITSQDDVINCRSRFALILMAKSVQLLLKNNFDAALAYETKAIAEMSKAQLAETPADPIAIQIDVGVAFTNEGNMQ